MFFAENTFVLAKGYRHTCSASPTKKVTSRGRGAGVKNKIQGAGPFWLNTCGWSSKVGTTGKKSHLQANHPQIWHDGTNSRILCQRAPKLQNTCFLLKRHLSLQKGTDTHVQLHQPKKWLQEAKAQVTKIKLKGLDLFSLEYLRMIFTGWPHRKKVASLGQASIDRKWWDKFKNFVPTCAQIAKQAVFFFWRYICPCKRGQTHMFSFTSTKSELETFGSGI